MEVTPYALIDIADFDSFNLVSIHMVLFHFEFNHWGVASRISLNRSPWSLRIAYFYKSRGTSFAERNMDTKNLSGLGIIILQITQHKNDTIL